MATTTTPAAAAAVAEEADGAPAVGVALAPGLGLPCNLGPAVRGLSLPSSLDEVGKECRRGSRSAGGASICPSSGDRGSRTSCGGGNSSASTATHNGFGSRRDGAGVNASAGGGTACASGGPAGGEGACGPEAAAAGAIGACWTGCRTWREGQASWGWRGGGQLRLQAACSPLCMGGWGLLGPPPPSSRPLTPTAQLNVMMVAARLLPAPSEPAAVHS